MKKISSLLLALAIMCSTVIPAFASELDLSQLADNYIEVETIITSDGTEINTYSNILQFVNLAHSNLPNVSDMEIAYYIMGITGQEVEAIPESDMLDMLSYDSITTSKLVVPVSDQEELFPERAGEVAAPSDVYTDENNTMQITTNFAYTGTAANGDKCFNVWSTAKWLDYPAICIEDAFALGTTGTFDSTVTEHAYVNQVFYHAGCGHYTTRLRSVDKNDTVDEDLVLRYESGIPYIKFTPYAPCCDYCNTGGSDYFFTAYLRYGVRCASSCIIMAKYSHTTFGVTGISLSFDGWEPIFSANLGTIQVDYPARAVLVTT